MSTPAKRMLRRVPCARRARRTAAGLERRARGLRRTRAGRRRPSAPGARARPDPGSRRARRRPGALAAGATVGRFITHALGVRHAAPALSSLPSSGRILISGPGGTWTAAADGSTRRLGSWPQASWSPRGLYVAVAAGGRLAAVDPKRQRPLGGSRDPTSATRGGTPRADIGSPTCRPARSGDRRRRNRRSPARRERGAGGPGVAPGRQARSVRSRLCDQRQQACRARRRHRASCCGRPRSESGHARFCGPATGVGWSCVTARGTCVHGRRQARGHGPARRRTPRSTTQHFLPTAERSRSSWRP